MSCIFHRQPPAQAVVPGDCAGNGGCPEDVSDCTRSPQQKRVRTAAHFQKRLGPIDEGPLAGGRRLSDVMRPDLISEPMFKEEQLRRSRRR